MITESLKRHFLCRIIRLQQNTLNHSTDGASIDKVYLEQRMTLLDLQVALESKEAVALIKRALSERWIRIQHCQQSYLQQSPLNQVNQLCYELATAISPPFTTNTADDLKEGEGPYPVLMPTLLHTFAVNYCNIHNLKFSEFVLSDDKTRYIAILDCLEQAAKSDDGQPRHLVGQDNAELSASEIARVRDHSDEPRALYEAVKAYNQCRIHGDGLGAKLTLLRYSLNAGGANAGADGDEFNAGVAANVEISNFHQCWASLSNQHQEALLRQTPDLRDVLARLFRGKEDNYKTTTFCVESTAGLLSPIINAHNEDHGLKLFKQTVLMKQCQFELAQQENKVALKSCGSVSPEGLFVNIHKRPLQQQK